MTYRAIIPVSLALTMAIAVGMTANAGSKETANAGSKETANAGTTPRHNGDSATFDTPPNFPFGSPVAACASAGCHGGGSPGLKGSEQSTWATADPHARAYRVLFNVESVNISRNLRKNDPNRPPAHRDSACLVCHASPHEAKYDGKSIANASDGVGCDACHGASSAWLTRHYEASWKTLGLAEKESLGFRNTKNLVTRIGTCVGCHVGDANREVTHDLIAAGHPRLAFEATRYHFSSKYKKHWIETLPNRDFEIRTWAIGQVLAAKAVVELARSRADRMIAKTVPWPELAEQGCFSCHQSLRNSLASASPRGLGRADWQPWYLATLDLVAARTGQFFPGTSTPDLKPIDELVAVMQKASPNPADVRDRALAAEKALAAWIDAIRASERDHPSASISADTLRSLAGDVAKRGETLGEWDRVAPHYLAAVAFYHADPGLFSKWKTPLEALKATINYPAGFNSPKQFDAGKSRDLFHEIAEGVGR